ncbi:CCDC90 family protein [Massilia sp. P8910]|uniref:CCDC90 family protein n=1 Tax=Massilia antarctica TaxID=2765360 RepID=UPI001E39EDBB|nr:CCDC90 family protein [Massilia antarctica]MCE3604925.1 CCDC90 family protein [Massilia antarctica]
MSMNAVPSGPPEPDSKDAPVEGGGGAPHDGGMDRRLTVLETRFDTILPTLATKADMAGLRLDLNEKMSSLRLDLSEKMSSLRLDLSEKMSGLRLELNEKMDEVSSDLHTASTNTIKWCVGIAMTPIVTIVGNGLYVRTQINNLFAPQPPVSPAAPGPDRSAASPTRTVPEAPPQPRTAPKPG